MRPVAFFYDRHVGSRLETNMKQGDHVLLAVGILMDLFTHTCLQIDNYLPNPGLTKVSTLFGEIK